MIQKLLLLFLLAFSVNVYGQYNGNVFVDANQNGKPDAGEERLSNINVSDGLNVVQTNSEGSFSLPGFAKTRFIFITAPAGYTPVKSHYLKAIGQDSIYNFGLKRDSTTSGKQVRMLHISDTETDVYGDWIANTRNFAREHHASFVVHTGDICYEKGMNFHAAQVNAQRIQKPVHYAMGNHDLVKGPYGESMFESLFGPPYYSFDAGPAHFIITPMAYGDFKPDYTLDQLIVWLRNDLKATGKRKPIIMFNHNLPFQNGSFMLKGINDSIALDQNGLKAWIYGHWHSNFVQKDQKTGIYTVCTGPLNKGGIDNSAGQFLSIDFDENGIKKIEPRYANLKEHLAIVEPFAGNMDLVNNGILKISAKVYDSEWTVRSVLATIFTRSGIRLASQQLTLKGDWDWRGSIAGVANWKGKEFTIYVEAEYANGAHTIKHQDFFLNNHPTEKALKLNWSTNIGAGVWKAAPLVIGQQLFVGTIDDGGNGRCGVTSLDTRTGKVLWKYQTKNSVKNRLCFENGMLLVTDMEGMVYALNAKDGKLIWTKSLGMTYLPGNLIGSIAHQGIYYTGFGKYLQAIRISNGELLWKNTAWTSGMGTPAQMAIEGNTLLVGSNWNALFAHDIKTGKLLWKRDDEGLRFRSSSPAFKDGLIYITGYNGLFVLDPKDGKTVKKIISPFDFKVMAQPLVTDHLVILPTAANGVIAYDKNTLQQVWHQPTGEALIYSSPYYSPDRLTPIQTVEPSLVGNDKRVFYGASDGYFYSVDGTTGHIFSKINLGTPIYAESTISEGKAFVAGFDGSIYCFAVSGK
ncbi:PQQ-binding-like beta-propeller repeat protein [Pedobacter psychrodurus]|uniref:outer membrane protein assembly factor BamB family protein n=1 Tax=Pedobacter psychrodurus TaxID=2530456 RepID=UPI00292E2777|nr:PQQ-binding-like beta-propeller repeat protein [Pedobacter psychrodurus]